MSGIEDLRQRVQEAEARFGSAKEEQAKYSARLIGLIDTVEGRLRDQQAEIDRQQVALAAHDSDATAARAEVSRLQHENEQVRDMLLSLLRAIETGGRNGLSETMQSLESKVSALMTGGIADTAAPEPAAAPEPEMAVEEPVETAPEPAPEIMAEEVVEPAPEMAAEEVAEAAPELEPEMATEEVAEVHPEPEPAPEMMAEEVAEVAPEPAPEMVVEEIVEPAPEMAAEEVAEVAPAAEAASSEDEATTAALDQIAQQLAAAPGKVSPAESDSLHEIMSRVSKLVRDTEAATDDAGTAAPAAASPAPAKKSAAG